jgi:hypothetical protein
VYLHFVFSTLHIEVGRLNDIVHFRDLSEPIGLDYHNEGLVRGIQGLHFQPKGKYLKSFIPALHLSLMLLVKDYDLDDFEVCSRIVLDSVVSG